MNEPANQVALPRAPVLGYLTRGPMTGLRVRNIAAGCTVGLAFLNALAAVLLGYFIWKEIQNHLWVWGPVAGAHIDYVHALVMTVKSYLMLVLGMLAFFILAPVMLIMVVPVWRGKAAPSYFMAACVVVEAGLVMLVTTLFTGVALVQAMPWHGPGDVRWLLNLLWTPVGIGLVLLMKDLAGYLRWIGGHPLEEKPRVRFLPGKGPGVSKSPTLSG